MCHTLLIIHHRNCNNKKKIKGCEKDGFKSTDLLTQKPRD